MSAPSSSNSQSVEDVDIFSATAVAAGTNKPTRRVVAGGIASKLMGYKESVNVTAEEIAAENLDNLLLRDQREREKYKNKKHISEQPWTSSNWYKHINWLNMYLTVFFPLIGFLYAHNVKLHLNTAIFAILYYFVGGLSITAGYHRLWAHKAYRATLLPRLFFAFFGASAVEGSVKWWGHSHRVHHRYVDTNRDPYNATRGFWFSHMGWMLEKANPRFRARADISDLVDDWVVRFQHKHYLSIMLFSAFVVPTLFCGYFFDGDYLGGFIYAGIFRTFFIQQATFCVNSLAHWIGEQPFDDTRTPRDHVLTALVTMGEGYHNFHHEFPTDYRNAIKWYQYDPTKILIWTLSKLGLAYNLKTFSQNAIEQGLVQQQQKKLDRMKASLNWGTPLLQLPVWTIEEFYEKCKKDSDGKKSGLVLISGIVHDVSKFVDEHPGGAPLIRTSYGKDATKAFSGGVYFHSNAAHNLLATMRVAVIKGTSVDTDTYKIQQKIAVTLKERAKKEFQ